MQFELTKDAMWALLVGAIFAASPHTGAARPKVSIVLGILIALAFLLARGLIRPRLPHLFSRGPRRRIFESPSATTWALLFAMLLVFSQTLRWLYGEYTLSIWRNGHGLFLPVIMALLVTTRLRERSDHEPSSSLWGAVPLLVGACLAVLDAGARTGIVGTVGLIVALPGLSLLLLGPERTRAIAFPLALSLFLLPMPDQLPDPLGLTSGTSFMMEKYLHLIGIPTFRNQTYFALPVGLFNVSTNCGGLSFFYGGGMFAVVLAYLTPSRWRSFVILASLWPLTVVINGIRGSVLIALSNRYGTEIADTFLHGITGIVTFWSITFALLLLADWRYILARTSK